MCARCASFATCSTATSTARRASSSADLRIAMGMKPDPRKVLSNWFSKGVIHYDEPRQIYVKPVGGGVSTSMSTINMCCLLN